MAETAISGINVPFIPIGGMHGKPVETAGSLAPERSFEAVFKKELSSLRFSKHAADRIAERQMQLDDVDLQKLDQAITKAEEKGSHDSLIFLREMAFIVSVRNRTVITAIDGSRLQDNVFTKIDSAVVAG